MKSEITSRATVAPDTLPLSDTRIQREERRPSLSVIVPFRDEGTASWYMQRLEEQCQSFPRRSDIEFIVVDSGSVEPQRERCLEICEDHHVRYLRHDSAGQTFSIGAARDFGVRYARGRAISFLDIDLRVAPDFWVRLLHLMDVIGVSKNKKKFFVIPCLYLTEDGTFEFLGTEPDKRFTEFYLRWLNGDKSSVENLAPCSSVMVVDRLHYLSVGGHRPEFRGHGYEDFELYHRLMAEESFIPRAQDYYKDVKSWETATYNGFRSQLSLLGRAALMLGLFVVHLWHPRPKTASFYGEMYVNREIWMDLFKEFDRTGDHPEPLVDGAVAGRRFLVFGRPRSNAMRCLRDVMPFLGNPLYVSEYDFVDEAHEFLEEEFECLLEKYRISMVLFPNPYGNSTRLKIYERCRKMGVPYLCFERGAFPDSWFFDSRGFNADSGSYAREHWDVPIREEERKLTKEYIHHCIQGADALEKQGARVGGEVLASRLRTGGKKVLFVPLQRPSDTVTIHMAGAIGSCDAFIALIDEAARYLRRLGWVVLCKKHPLETETPPLVHAQYVPDDTHFIDLLELADSVALINSGVGAYAMMMGKPCYIFGDAFYQFDGINEKIVEFDAKALAKTLSKDAQVDMEAVYRFTHYLSTKFYSFGQAKTVRRKEADGSLRSVTTAIDFYRIRLPGGVSIDYEKATSKPVSSDAPLFERYKLDLWQKARKNENTKAVPAAAGVPMNTAKDTQRRLPEEVRAAKSAKLRHDPRAFFRDAKNPVLRPLKHLFPKK